MKEYLIIMTKDNHLSDLIGKPDNLEIIRLFAAIGVVFGHSFALAMRGNSGVSEPVSIILPGTYSGSIAVEMFFFISGFLITNSLLVKPNLLQFLRARAVRVLPAFFVMIFLSALVLAPFASKLSFFEYFRDPGVWKYIFSTLSLDLIPGTNIIWAVPQTFLDHKNSALNGSIWSLFFEVKLYLLSAFGILLSAYKYSKFGTILATFGLCYTLHNGALRSPDDYIMSAIFMYWLGCLFRFYSNKVIVSIFPLLFAFIMVYYFRQSTTAIVFYSMLIASAVIYFAYAEWLPKLKLPGDYSFGLFLWSFPVQQLLAQQWPTLGPYRFFVVSLALSFVFAILSWHFIEKPAITWNKARKLEQSLPRA